MSTPAQEEQLSKLVRDFGITLTSRVSTDEEERYAKDNPPWPHTTWHCVLRFSRQAVPTKIETGYRMGLGHRGRPKVADVLHSLLVDCNGIDGTEDFEDWASGYGYDTDSRSAERMYRVCVETSVKMREFLGDHFDRFQRAEH